jgi:hypothetical protein
VRTAAERLSGNCQTTMQLAKPCFDRLSTNGKNTVKAMPDPFALSLSKGERGMNSPCRVISGEPLNVVAVVKRVTWFVRRLSWEELAQQSEAFYVHKKGKRVPS